jgi:hypothetical protein
MVGRKTREQQVRTLERKSDVPKAREVEPEQIRRRVENAGRVAHRDMPRQSEFAVSRQGMHQESEHNKHNKPRKGAQ